MTYASVNNTNTQIRDIFFHLIFMLSLIFLDYTINATLHITHKNLYVFLLDRGYGSYSVLDAGVIGLGTGSRGRRAQDWERQLA